jgi:anti-sigma factor RsiW
MTVCDQTERVAEYVLRALPAADRAAFEWHLADCAACREELATLRVIGDALTDWPTDVLRPTAPLWTRLADRIGAPAADRPATSEARWADEPAWKQVAPGISCKLLATDQATQRVSMLVRLAPNTSYPPHTHAGVEELHLLDGELWIEDRLLHPGDYNRGEPGTGDERVYSETGCTCVLITSFSDVLR